MAMPTGLMDGDSTEEVTEVGPDPIKAISELREVLRQLTTAVSPESQMAGQVLDRVVAARLKLEWTVDDLAQALGCRSVTKR